MSTVTKKSVLILLGILFLEAVPFALLLRFSSPAGVARLYAFRPYLWPAWLAAGVTATAYVLYAVRGLPIIGKHFFDPHPMKLIAIPFAFITGTMEELWFRKLIIDAVTQHGLGAGWQVLASACAFGMAHGIWGLFARQWRMALGAAVATGLLGVCLALVYLLAGRQIAPCIWAHMLINLAIEPWLMVAAVSAGSGGFGKAPKADYLPSAASAG